MTSTISTAPRVTLQTLGGWLLKGNADRADLPERFGRQPRVERWCVRPGYRARLMDAGQNVLFWASGNRRRDVAYGVWGAGRLAGPARRDPADGHWWVPLDLVVAEPAEWVSRAELKADPRLAGLEVLRQPQGPNPSFVTPAEWAAIAGHRGRHR